MIARRAPGWLGVELSLAEHYQALNCVRQMVQRAPLPIFGHEPPRRYLPSQWSWRCIYAERVLDGSVRLVFAIIDHQGQEVYRRAVRLIKREPLRLV